jgi:hypothetical protein
MTKRNNCMTARKQHSINSTFNNFIRKPNLSIDAKNHTKGKKNIKHDSMEINCIFLFLTLDSIKLPRISWASNIILSVSTTSFLIPDCINSTKTSEGQQNHGLHLDHYLSASVFYLRIHWPRKWQKRKKQTNQLICFSSWRNKTDLPPHEDILLG